MYMLGASCLESTGCAGRGGQNLLCMEVAAKMLITYELRVEMAVLSRRFRQDIHCMELAVKILIR
jgi:hypothetical protein